MAIALVGRFFVGWTDSCLGSGSRSTRLNSSGHIRPDGLMNPRPGCPKDCYYTEMLESIESKLYYSNAAVCCLSP